MSSEVAFTERVVAESPRYSGAVFTVLTSQVEVAPGRVESFEVVTKGADSVALLPVSDSGMVHLVEEYCPATARRQVGLPKGGIEAGEEPSQAAQRELAEELSLTGDLFRLATFDLQPGYLRQSTVVYLVRNLRPARGSGDERTNLITATMPFAEAVARARNGQFTDVRLVASLLLAEPMVMRSGKNER
ncbi:NUDIX hydrolase [Nonomuraea sp. B19D2]|uniref:NUDIX hydrolase n=1 Tax=Nonomuraea sp. B19D2 TaxID=3159561 RepID=UPI0032DADF6F